MIACLELLCSSAPLGLASAAKTDFVDSGQSTVKAGYNCGESSGETLLSQMSLQLPRYRIGKAGRIWGPLGLGFDNEEEIE